jgi:hypothetical protein
MRLRERYRRLTLWNKVALWGSLASIVGLAMTLVPRFSGPTVAPANLTIDSIELGQNSFEGVIDLRVRNSGDRVALIGSALVSVLRSWELQRTDLIGTGCTIPPRPMELMADRTYDVPVRAHTRQSYTVAAKDFARRVDANGLDRFKLGLMSVDCSDSILLAEVRVRLTWNEDAVSDSELLLVAVGDQDQLPWLSRVPAILESPAMWESCPADRRGAMPGFRRRAMSSLAQNYAAVDSLRGTVRGRASVLAGRVIATFP